MRWRSSPNSTCCAAANGNDFGLHLPVPRVDDDRALYPESLVPIATAGALCLMRARHLHSRPRAIGTASLALPALPRSASAGLSAAKRCRGARLRRQKGGSSQSQDDSPPAILAISSTLRLLHPLLS